MEKIDTVKQVKKTDKLVPLRPQNVDGHLFQWQGADKDDHQIWYIDYNEPQPYYACLARRPSPVAGCASSHARLVASQT